jgi:DNA-directed RNA polymerase specialized sigma subunit
MSNVKPANFKDLLSEELKDLSFKEEFILAKEVMLLRKTNNQTQKELAKLAGTSQPAIERLESGNLANFINQRFIRNWLQKFFDKFFILLHQK